MQESDHDTAEYSCCANLSYFTHHKRRHNNTEQPTRNNNTDFTAFTRINTTADYITNTDVNYKSSQKENDKGSFDVSTTVQSLPYCQNKIKNGQCFIKAGHDDDVDIEPSIENHDVANTTDKLDDQNNESMSVNKSTFEVRQTLYEKIKEMNLNISKQKAQNKEKIECSFRPKLNNSTTHIRTANEFYDDQIKYIEKSNQKLQIASQINYRKERHEFTGKPNINHNSQWDSNSKRKKINRCKNNENAGSVGKPTINQRSRNLVRNESVDNILYNDALRRRSSHSKRSNSISTHSFMLDTSKFYLIKSLESQLDSAYKSICKNVNILSKDNIVAIMIKLGFYRNEDSLLNELWKVLRGEELGGVSYCNLFIFLLSVLNIYCPWMQKSSTERLKQQFIITESYKEEEEETAELGFFPLNSLDFCVTEKDVLRIHDKFSLFHKNRTLVNKKEKLAPIEPEHKPIINPISLSLAQKFRDASLRRMDNNEAFSNKGKNFYDYLNYIGFEYSCNKQKDDVIEETAKPDYTSLQKYWECTQRTEQLYREGVEHHKKRNYKHQASEDSLVSFTYRPNNKFSSPKVTEVYNQESVKKCVKRMEIGRLKTSANVWLKKKGFAGSKVVNKIKELDASIPKHTVNLNV